MLLMMLAMLAALPDMEKRPSEKQKIANATRVAGGCVIFAICSFVLLNFYYRSHVHVHDARHHVLVMMRWNMETYGIVLMGLAVSRILLDCLSGQPLVLAEYPATILGMGYFALTVTAVRDFYAPVAMQPQFQMV
jgi:hypothetical protein